MEKCHIIVVLLCLVAARAGEQNIKSEAADMEEEIRILVTHPEVSDEALDILRRNCKVTVLQNSPPVRSEILEKAKGVHGILWAGGGRLNGEVLDAAGPQLKAISTMQAGLDQVDIPELKRRRIPLGHTPIVLKKAVADLAVGLMLAAGRRFHEGRLHIENSTWDTGSIKFLLGQDLRGVRVGFFGFGSIGQEIAKRLEAFEIGSVIYHTRRKVNDSDAEHVTFDELLEQSDILFITAPLTPETQNKFDAHAFNKMKSTAVLVNVGRGETVDQKALYDALKSNKIFAAGLDVMTPEPLPPDDPLVSLPNCVLVPHLGSATERTRNEMALIAAHNVLQGIAGAHMFAPAYELEKD